MLRPSELKLISIVINVEPLLLSHWPGSMCS